MHHPPHSFSFAELHTPDIERARQFYGAMFGWTAVPFADGYWMFQIEGRDVAGMRRTEGPHRWIPYVTVASADDMAARARERGAEIETPLLDTPDLARTCVLADREGALFGVWESRGHSGAEVQDEVSTLAHD